MEKLKLAHSKQVEEFSTDVQKVLSLTETTPLNDTVASLTTNNDITTPTTTTANNNATNTATHITKLDN